MVSIYVPNGARTMAMENKINFVITLQVSLIPLLLRSGHLGSLHSAVCIVYTLNNVFPRVGFTHSHRSRVMDLQVYETLKTEFNNSGDLTKIGQLLQTLILQLSVSGLLAAPHELSIDQANVIRTICP